jgi:hypothetical protein
MTERGANALLKNGFKLGADASVVAGPVGWGSQAALANVSADILSFSRSEEGLYGGISLGGAVVTVRGGLNEAYYGKKVSPGDILVRHEVNNPQTACLFQGLALARSEGAKVASAMWMNGRCEMANAKLESIRKSIEELSLDEKREFISEVVPDVCDSSLTKEGCRTILEEKLSGSRYLESFDVLRGGWSECPEYCLAWALRFKA